MAGGPGYLERLPTLSSCDEIGKPAMPAESRIAEPERSLRRIRTFLWISYGLGIALCVFRGLTLTESLVGLAWLCWWGCVFWIINLLRQR